MALKADSLGSGFPEPLFALTPFSPGVLQVVVPPNQVLNLDGRTAPASQATSAIINARVGPFRVKSSRTHRRVTCFFRGTHRSSIAAGLFPL